MTSAESTLLGIGIGALLTWFSGAAQSRWQWRREERRRIADRRAELYQDTLVFMDRIRRVRYRNELEGRHGARPDDLSDEQAEEERAVWNARIQLYASREVQDRWEEWTFAVAEDAIAAHQLKEELIARMRSEVGLS